MNKNNDLTVNDIITVIITDEAGKEKLAADRHPSGEILPVVFLGSVSDIDLLKIYTEKRAKEWGEKLTLARFSNREDLKISDYTHENKLKH